MTSLLFIIGMFLNPVNVSVENSTASYLGDWEYEVETPDITYEGVISLSEEGGKLVGVISSNGEDTDLNDVTIDDNALSFNMEVQGFVCEVTGTFEGDMLTAEVAVEGMALPLVAKRL